MALRCEPDWKEEGRAEKEIAFEGGERDPPEMELGRACSDGAVAVAIRFASPALESRERRVVGFVLVDDRTV